VKPPLQKSPIPQEHAFVLRHLKEPHFDANWHFHSEYQIFVVLHGTGTRFIGDHVCPFKPGEVVVTGPNLPHLWRSDHEYFESRGLMTEGIVIYFHENFFGSEFLNKTEMHRIRQLLTRASRGIEIHGATRELVRQMMFQMREEKNFESVLTLLHLLNVISNTNEYKLLSSKGYSNTLKESDTERMNRVHEYVMKKFKEKITLDEAASQANMSPTSFSRYFKNHANKTFSHFLSEIRIGYSCKLLQESEATISEICYASGYNTLSNFNRQFKSVTNYTPMEYKKRLKD
jgi:AraC-like DNA-binding protein/quercetin dioxygenase-like cupin family protein